MPVPAPGALEVDYPAADPLVTAVGGTTRDPSSGSEAVWNWVNNGDFSGDGGGGGVSRYLGLVADQPEVQVGYGVGQACPTDCREVPDLSSNAGTGEWIYSGGAWVAVGGTSTSAPLLAGLVADRNEGCTSVTGDFAPALYSLYATSGHGDGSAFGPVTTGDNDITGANGGRYAANPSGTYSVATGLGTPLASGLTCPEVTSIVPADGTAGAHVTVNGLGLEAATFKFGATTASIVGTPSATSATVVVPAGSGLRAVSASGILGAGTQTASFTGPPARLAITAQPPTDTTSGVSFSVGVSVEDAGGNVTNSSTPVGLAITTGTGTAGATLSCATEPVDATSGVATLSCSIDTPGTGYTLTATSPGLTPAVTSSFTNLGTTQLTVITQPPADVITGVNFNVAVAVQDNLGATVNNSVAPVALAITAAPERPEPSSPVCPLRSTPRTGWRRSRVRSTSRGAAIP